MHSPKPNTNTPNSPNPNPNTNNPNPNTHKTHSHKPSTPHTHSSQSHKPTPHTLGPDTFVARDPEARAILHNTNNQHSSLIVAEAGLGKSALIQFLSPVLAEQGKLITTDKVGPGFTTWLKEVYEGLWHHQLIPKQTKSCDDDLKTFNTQNKSNDDKALYLLKIIQDTDNIILTIDDASGISPSSRPWLIRFTEACTLIAAIDPKALHKPSTKRFWKLFDEVKLNPLSRTESKELLEQLIKRYQVTTDDPEVYQRAVLDLAQGNPFELNRLVKYHSSESLVKSREIQSQSHNFVERDVKQLAIAPLFLVALVFSVAGRYIARVQGDLDIYVLSAIGLGILLVFAPFLRTALKPRAN